MKPTNLTKFLPISELVNYCDDKKYFCSAVVFSPETENNHFNGCKPYIEIISIDDSLEYYFEIPEIVAYFAKTHPCYTMAGRDKMFNDGVLKGKQEVANLFRALMEALTN